MQGVGDDELLVLLLMGQAQAHDGGEGGESVVIGPVEQTADSLVDVGPPASDGLVVRAGQQTSPGSRDAGADAVVIGVEQEAVVFVPGRDTAGPQQELLEEPGGVGPMPFGGAGVGHRLHLLVLGRQQRRQGLGPPTHATIRVQQRQRPP